MGINYSDIIYNWVVIYFKSKYKFEEPAEDNSKNKNKLSKQVTNTSNKLSHILDEVGGFLLWLYDKNNKGKISRLKTIDILENFNTYEEAKPYLVSVIKGFKREERKEMAEKERWEISLDNVLDSYLNPNSGPPFYELVIHYTYARLWQAVGKHTVYKEIQAIRDLCKGTKFSPMKVVEELIYPLGDGIYETPYELRKNVLYHFKKLVKREYGARVSGDGLKLLEGDKELLKCIPKTEEDRGEVDIREFAIEEDDMDVKEFLNSIGKY